MTARPARSSARLRSSVRNLARTTYSEAILAAAERLILRDGYHATHMAAVAAEAGISVGTLYKHFPSKEAVFESLVERGRNEGIALMRACIDMPEPKARLRAFIEQLFAHVESQNALLAIWAEHGPKSVHQVPAKVRAGDDQAILEIIDIFEATLEEGARGGTVREDVEPRLLAAMLVGAVKATLMAWIHADRSYSLSERVDPLLALFWEGALRR
jgi:AcrR family transcriptional regulator